MKKAAFFDFAGTLFRLTPTGWKLCPSTLDHLIATAKTSRIGLLCNLPAGHTAESLKLLLRVHGVDAWLDPRLSIIASLLPTPLPDAGAFQVAAALAQAAPADLHFVSAHPASRNEAARQGWTAEAPPAEAEGAAVPALLAAAEVGAAQPALLAEVDPDQGPTFVLKGRVVTMNPNSDVLPSGRILVRKGKIQSILGPNGALPPEFAAAPVLDTGCTLYPGLIDLHNHLAYNTLTLWNVPRKFAIRNEWQRHKDYPANISLPARVLAGHDPTAKAAARYIEAKAIVGGCTTSQGVLMIEKKIVKYFRGLMRNVENTGDARLPEASSSVLDLDINNSKSVASFRKNVQTSSCFFYHLSEGTNPAAHTRFQDLLDLDLLGPSLVGIHSLALKGDDLKKLHNAGGKIVWSPFSNLLLYGQSLDLANVVNSGIRVALGCDWAPSGSKNPLLELKVAQFLIRQANAAISAEQLVRMVTSTPAAMLGWQEHLGTLKANAMADIVAVAGVDGNAYEHLINARERDVKLVTIHGTPRYGDEALMRAALPAGTPLEEFTVDGAARVFHFKHPESLINDLGLKAAIDTLETAMADLPKFVRDTGQVKAGLLAAGLDPADEFGLVLDMDAADAVDESGLAAATLLAAVDPNKIAKSVDLDPLSVNVPFYLEILEREGNLPQGLATALKQAYA